MKSIMQAWNKKQLQRIQFNMEKKFQIAGVTFEGRQDILEKLNQEYHEIGFRRIVELVPDPENKYDSNAVKVQVNLDGNVKQLGYVPKTINSQILELVKNEKIKWAKLSDIGRVQESGVLGGTITYEEKEK